MILLSKPQFATLAFICALIVTGCSSGSKQAAPFNPPAMINLSAHAAQHIVAVPGGSLGLRPFFQPAEGTALPPNADSRRLIDGLQVITTRTNSPTALLALKPSFGA